MQVCAARPNAFPLGEQGDAHELLMHLADKVGQGWMTFNISRHRQELWLVAMTCNLSGFTDCVTKYRHLRAESGIEEGQIFQLCKCTQTRYFVLCFEWYMLTCMLVSPLHPVEFCCERIALLQMLSRSTSAQVASAQLDLMKIMESSVWI